MLMFFIKINLIYNYNLIIIKLKIYYFSANEDLKRKMYGCILVVGGGMKFQGIGKWLQNRISLQIPYMFRAGKKINFTEIFFS